VVSLDGSADDPTGGDATAARATASTSARAPTTTSTSRPPTAGTTVTVSPPDGAFTVELPELWIAGFPGTDVPVAVQMAGPGETGPDGRIEMIEDMLVTPMTRMLAVDRETWLDVLPSDMLLVEGMTDMGPIVGDPAELQKVAEPSGIGVTVRARGRLEGVSGEISWSEFVLEEVDQNGVRYIVAGTDSVWVITYWTDRDPADARPVADDIVASFDPA
ncbi:MAG TPA: hypothetical protein VFZ77_02360, partial [Acidimicrobiales bacterium]